MSAKVTGEYSQKEAQHRTEAALRAAFNVPHKAQSEMKLGKAKAKATKSPKQKRATSPKSA